MSKELKVIMPKATEAIVTPTENKEIISAAKAAIAPIKEIKALTIKGDQEKPVMPAWEVVMRTIIPPGCLNAGRPRRTSLHTLASAIGVTDLLGILNLAKELKESKKVVGYRCPDVQCLIFYLDELSKLPGMIDSRNPDVWKLVDAHVTTEAPFPQVRGFRRFTNYYDSKTNKNVTEPNGMEYMYESNDYAYAMKVRENLLEAGFNPPEYTFRPVILQQYNCLPQDKAFAMQWLVKLQNDNPDLYKGRAEDFMVGFLQRDGKQVMKVVDLVSGKSIEL
jgi:hypothetical protein